MATLHDIASYRKPTAITHYAYYGDLYGTAELLGGSGYLFRAEGERKATLVSYKDPELLLLGLVDLAEAQREADGDLAAKVCGGAPRVASAECERGR